MEQVIVNILGTVKSEAARILIYIALYYLAVITSIIPPFLAGITSFR